MTERLAAGTHGGLWIDAARDIEGGPGVVIDPGGRGHGVFVGVNEAAVRLSGLRLTRGHGELGGGLRAEGWSAVTVEDCVFEGNVGAAGGAAGAGVNAGAVRFVRCRFGPKDDLLLTGACEVTLQDCDVAGDVRVREGAVVRFERGRVGGTLDVCGTTTRAPTVGIAGTAIAAIVNDEVLPGAITRG